MNDDIENQKKLARAVKVYPAAAGYVPNPLLSNLADSFDTYRERLIERLKRDQARANWRT